MSELDKKLMQTPDLNKERLEKLKILFPDLFTVEGKLNPDELKKIVDPDLVRETERFEFKWFGKSEAKRNAFTPSKATLIYNKERSVNPEYADGNMIIEGENLETLKVLLSGYRERIKCIYIDPPYNTGKDFVYSDKWDEDKEDYWEQIGVTQDGVKVDTNTDSSGRYHSNWLNMMYSRLLIARQLLREDGVIFISIDDNEVHHLRKLCDEVFGEGNFVSSIIWQKKTGASDAKTIANITEYILVYVKSFEQTLNNFARNKESYDIERYRLSDEFINDRGKYYIDNLDRGGLQYSKSLNYPITCPDGTITYPNGKKEFTDEGWIWKWSKKKVEWAIENKFIEFRESKSKESGWAVCYKNYLLVGNEGNRIERSAPLKNLINDVLNANSAADIKEIFENTVFPYSKPVELIKTIFKFILFNNGDLILDFFAGSGTTAHAVMELNKKDNGSRKFILVQIPELTDEKSEAYKAGYKRISDITIERNKRVIQRIEKEEAEKQPSLLDSDKKPFKTGFKVYKLAKSNFPRVDFAPDPAKTEEENLALLNQYIDEKEAMYLAMIDEKNIIDEVILKNGFILNYSKEKVNDFSKNKVFHVKDDFKECLICMDMSIANETLKELEQYKDKIFICLERALNTTMKWNLKHLFGEKLVAF